MKSKFQTTLIFSIYFFVSSFYLNAQIRYSSVLDQTKYIDSLIDKADKGNDSAMCLLGKIYLAEKRYLPNGELYKNEYGVISDYKEAQYWYRKAADLGNRNAMMNLGYSYNASKDYKQAKYWYEKVIDLDKDTDNTLKIISLREAMYNLGLLYLNGNGVLQNPKEAFYWFDKAANKEMQDAQYVLCILYFYGNGIEIDKKKSAYWCERSYNNGYEAAKEFWDNNELWKYK